MVELWIDDRECDIDSLPKIPIGFDVDKLKKAEGGRSGRTIELELPATPRNDAVFGSSKDVYATSRFNLEQHNAVVKLDGIVIFEGAVYLCATTIRRGGCEGYKIQISEGGAGWIEPVVYGKLSDLDIPFAAYLDLATISDSWEGDSAVRFLPVRRSDKRYGYSPSAMPVELIMLTDDYHPFISIAEMVRAMFAQSGYTMRSNFFDSEFGRSLYMSGDYARNDAADAKAKCDFFARRSAPTTAVADDAGRVYASNRFAAHSLGPMVDTADPTAVDSDGNLMVDTFNTLSAFSKKENGDICFTPARSVKAGFVLHLEYTTECKILSRDRLQGFDVVEGLDGVRVEFMLANTCKDYKRMMSPNLQYRVFVFDHVEGREYELATTYLDGTAETTGRWSSRSALVKTADKEPVAVSILYRDRGSTEWNLYREDWALYAGYIEERGKVDVCLDLRLPPQEITSGGSLDLDKLWFGGAEPGMEITLGVGTTLRPYFTTVPGVNSKLEFGDVAPRYIRQVELLDALGRMFNLTFFTDEKGREVYIEPLESFYDGEEIDVNDKICLSRGVEIADAGLDMPQTHKFSYRATDYATNRFNLENEDEFGSWSRRNRLYCTVDSTKDCGVELFTTTINVEKVTGFAPSASLMQVGDIGKQQDEGIDVAFTPHIVCYKGMRPLPENECWIAMSKYDSYPYATFADSEDVNLCFEGRNGVEGLCSYHIPELVRQEEGQRVTLDMHFTTAEAAALLMDDGPKSSVRKSFRFEIEGESSLYRLVKIKDWDTQNGIVRCTFERLLKD